MQNNQKQNCINAIDNYFSNLNKLEEQERNSKFNNIKEQLAMLDAFMLMDLYLKYADDKYTKKYDLKDILEELANELILKLKDISVIKAIDLYLLLFDKTLLVKDTLIASKNVLSVMSFNISNDEYIAKEVNKKKISKEQFVANCKKDLEDYVNLINCYEKSNNYLEDLEDKVLYYIDTAITNLDSKSSRFLLENLSSRFENISEKILRLQDSFENPKKASLNDLYDMASYTSFKNRLVVYGNFRDTLQKNATSD